MASKSTQFMICFTNLQESNFLQDTVLSLILNLIRAWDKADKELGGEPDVDDPLHDGEGQKVRAVFCGELWQGVQCEDDGGDKDSKGGGDCYGLGNNLF